MKTLYDLLGALPDDDAEGLRSAFRRAVKGAHPDIRPGDLDAAQRFRQIVRAHEMLGDPAQRAAYDHLLELARLEHMPARTRASAVRMRRAPSGVMTLVAASVATVGAYLLFMHMASAFITLENDVDGPAWSQVSSISAPESAGATDGSASFAKRFSSSETIGSSGGSQSETVSIPADNVEAASEPGTIKARLRLPAILATPSGDISGAGAYVDQALPFGPTFLAAVYIDHSTIFYRPRRFGHRFAGMVRASQTAKPRRLKPPLQLVTSPRRDHAVVARSVTPLPRRQLLAQDIVQR
ncbi:MAG TPA: J domain-containing protein [Blastocatellia bacterium]|nr:J domain-containing protein [Blastocatellia bacterium]